MAVIEDIRQSLEHRLEDVEAEMVALTAALSAIAGEGGSQRRPRTVPKAASSPSPRRARSTRAQTQPRRSKPSSAPEGDGQPRKPDAPPKQAEARPRKPDAPAKQAEARERKPDAPAKQAEARPSEAEAPAKQAEARPRKPASGTPATEARPSAPDAPAKQADAQPSAPDAPAKEAETLPSEPDTVPLPTEALKSEPDALAVETDAHAGEAGGDPSGGDDQTVLNFFLSWPERPEAEQLAQELATLSPVQLSKMRQFVEQEIDRRRQSRPVGFTISASRGTPTPSSQRLIQVGFVRLRDGRLELTDRGRAAGRLLARGRADAAPPWWEDVVARALEPRG